MPTLGLERRQQTEVGGSCLAAVVTGNRASGGGPSRATQRMHASFEDIG